MMLRIPHLLCGDHEMLGEGKTSLSVWNVGISHESFILLMNLWYLYVKGERMIPLVYFFPLGTSVLHDRIVYILQKKKFLISDNIHLQTVCSLLSWFTRYFVYVSDFWIY